MQCRRPRRLGRLEIHLLAEGVRCRLVAEEAVPQEVGAEEHSTAAAEHIPTCQDFRSVRQTR